MQAGGSGGESYRVYTPIVVQYLIFWKERIISKRSRRHHRVPKAAPSTSRLELPKFDLRAIEELENISVNDEPDFITIESRRFFQKEGGWVELTVADIQKTINELSAENQKQVSKILTFNPGLKFAGCYTTLICGTTKNYWGQSKIELYRTIARETKELTLSEVVARSKIEILADELGSGSGSGGEHQRVRANIITVAKMPTKLYGLSPRELEAEESPSLLILDLTVGEELPGTSEQSVTDIELKMYESNAWTLSLNLARYLAYYSRVLQLFSTEYYRMEQKLVEIREKVRDLQTRINEILIGEVSEGGVKVRKLKTQKRVRESKLKLGTEEDMLRYASMYFSIVTEIQQELGDIVYKLRECIRSRRTVKARLGLAEVSSEHETLPSLDDEIDSQLTGIEYMFQDLQENLNNSQTNLRNTVEILRTSVESKQRSASERTSRAIGFLAILFASFGIADALTNLIAYYLSVAVPENKFLAATMTVVMFAVAMLVSVAFFGMLYLLWLKPKLRL